MKTRKDGPKAPALASTPDQRGRYDQKTRAWFGSFAMKKEVDDLNRLAESHVIQPDSAEAQLRQEPKPADAVDLVGPKCGV